MPKIHDACQILAEEILGQLVFFPEHEQGPALNSALIALTEALQSRHPEAKLIENHLKLVLDKLQGNAFHHKLYDTTPAESPKSPRLVSLISFVIDTAQRLFP